MISSFSFKWCNWFISVLAFVSLCHIFVSILNFKRHIQFTCISVNTFKCFLSAKLEIFAYACSIFAREQHLHCDSFSKNHITKKQKKMKLNSLNTWQRKLNPGVGQKNIYRRDPVRKVWNCLLFWNTINRCVFCIYLLLLMIVLKSKFSVSMTLHFKNNVICNFIWMALQSSASFWLSGQILIIQWMSIWFRLCWINSFECLFLLCV